MNEKQKIYRVTGIAMFAVAASLLFMRIIANFVSQALANTALSDWEYELILDICFSVPVQVGFLLLTTALIYKIGLKKSTKEVFLLSGFNKPSGKKVALAFVIGVCAYIGTIGVSSIWQNIIGMFGYNSSSYTAYPENFNIGVFLLSLILTAVLPGICEEFAMRGILSKTLDFSFSDKTAVIVGGIAFGLFHQNIEQVVYTMLFGMLITYIMIKTGCIWYGIIIHFTNNALATIVANSMQYDFALGKAMNYVFNVFGSTPIGSIMIFGVCGLGVVLCVMLAKAIGKKEKTPQFDENGNQIFGKLIYKPTKRDNIWYIGAIIATVLATLFTFMFGYLR